jgi:hypothetical protein
MHSTIVYGITLISIIFCVLNIESIYAQNIENWKTFPAKRFILIYPPDLELKGKENFLSSVDVTLGNPSLTGSLRLR